MTPALLHRAITLDSRSLFEGGLPIPISWLWDDRHLFSNLQFAW